MNESVFTGARVKLPNPNGYSSGPSGDTEYEIDYRKALHEALPVGYEYAYPRTGQHWAVDSEGYTLATLKCTDPDNALVQWRDRAQQAEETLRRLRREIGLLLKP